LHASPPAPPGNDSQISRPRLARALAVDHDRHTGIEVRLADQQLAAPSDLDDNLF